MPLLVLVRAGAGSALASTHFYALRHARFSVNMLGRVSMVSRTAITAMVPVAYVLGLIHNSDSVWIEGVGSNLARLFEAWDGERMDCLMLLACASHGSFRWLARDAADWRTPFADWQGTRYEAKALRAGRSPAYLVFTRV